MGTRGLWAYRWRRRYYTTYNHYDSYPSGLGTQLVAKIPSDPEDFVLWVEALKCELEGRDDGEATAPENDVFIEWTYVIDLDRNVFSVNGLDHIRLDMLPRGEEDDEWTYAFDRDHPANVELPCPIAPSDEHIALYDTVHASLSATFTPPTGFIFDTCGILMDQLFRNFCFVYDPAYVSKFRPDQWRFFATARGIVALATWGDFDIVPKPMTQPVHRTLRERGNATPEWTIPALSMPTHFWHRAVLFVLDSGLDDDTQLQGAVGRAVHLWRACKDARRRTIAFVITLRDLVQIDLSDDTNVRHTAPVPLTIRDFKLTEDNDNDEGFPVKMACAPTSPGFAMLKEILTPNLPASSSAKLPGPFPLDVLERLLDSCDTETLGAFAETCKSIRTLWHHRPRLDVGPYRLLHSIGRGVFTALDADGDTTSVLVGGLRFTDYEVEGVCGYSLRLLIKSDDKRNLGRPRVISSHYTEPVVTYSGVAEAVGLSVRAVDKDKESPESIA